MDRKRVPYAPVGHQVIRLLRDEFSRETGKVRCECGHRGNLLDLSEHLQSQRKNE